jgi:hypothetical protein
MFVVEPWLKMDVLSVFVVESLPDVDVVSVSVAVTPTGGVVKYVFVFEP